MRHSYTPTLNELQAFTSAARAGSATAAALGLGLTQSAISRSLSTLEGRLGVALFHRIRQRLTLSDAGRAFLPEAERLLENLDRAALTVMSFGGHRDVLRLACLPTFAALWLIPRLARFAVHAPEVTLDMSATLVPLDFDRDPRDAAILRGKAAPKGMQVEHLADETLVTVAAPSLLPGGPLTDESLARLPLLQQSTRPELWRDWFSTAPDPIRILRGPRFEQFAMVLAAARAGLGVALLPEAFVTEDLSAGQLRRASTRVMASDTPYLLTFPDRSLQLPAFTRFRDWLRIDATRPFGDP